MKFGASPAKGRLAKSAVFSALALSTLAGSVMLSGVQAQAVPCGIIYSPPGSATCIVPDPSINPNPHTVEATYIDSSFAPLILADSTRVKVEYETTGLYYPNSQTQIDTDFTPPITAADGASQFAKYTVRTLDPGVFIDGFDLAFDGVNPVSGTNPKVIKEVFDNANFTGTPILTLIQDGAGMQMTQTVPGRTQYWIMDTFIPGDGNIDNAVNTVRTPGPLPVLGAGAAFGFSRKLRGRIKATSAS